MFEDKGHPTVIAQRALDFARRNGAPLETINVLENNLHLQQRLDRLNRERQDILKLYLDKINPHER